MRKRQWLVSGVLALAACAFASVFGFFFFRDNLATHYPLKVVSASVFRAGEIPYWNFYDGGGQPLAGNPNTLTFYPDNFLYLLLPEHVAFNLHFLLHLAAAWFAMRALSRSPHAAWLYVLSGAAISATAFYNLIVAIAVIPFAFWAAQRRRPLLLGGAFGLLALAGEPVTILAAAIAVAILWPSWRLAIAAAISIVIALPQIIAYAEIAREVERARGYSAQTVLSASLAPRRLLEILIGPLLNVSEPHLFLSLFIGIIAIPALLYRRQAAVRWKVIAAASLFFALGRFNPLVAAAVDALPRLRIIRYPEKFAIVLTIAIVVLAAGPLQRRLWQWIALVPAALFAMWTIPIDWFAPYAIPRQKPARLYVAPSAGGQEPSRTGYRERARRLEPAFGAAGGIRYALDRSPDGMFSLMTRVATERVQTTRDPRWMRIARCENAAGFLPRAFFVPRIAGANDVTATVHAIESPSFDEHSMAIGQPRLDGFRSPPEATVLDVREDVQTLSIRVRTPAPAVLLVNETYFSAWDAGGLETVRLDLDRLGILVPAGERTIVLRFGRHRTAVAVTWFLSLLLLTGAAFALRVKVLDRRAGEIERSADEDRAARGA